MSKVASPFASLFAVGLCALPLRAAHGQDTRSVSEPRIPPTCVALPARLSAPKGLLSDAAEQRPDTKRIQDAIDGCSPGKAVVLRSEGGKDVFLSGPLHLKAGVTLLVAARTALFASRNPRDYDVTPGSCGVVAEKRTHCAPFISALKAPGAGIMGDGAIDGRGGGPLLGAAGRDPRGGSVTWWDLAKDAKVKDLHQSCPGLIVARESDNFTLYRITLRNAAKAHVVADKLDGFTAWGVKIKTPKTARNTDGINPQSSTNVTIAHCSIDTGDDNVAVKAGANGPVSHVTIAHNHFYAGHGMSIGSETSGGVNAVSVVDLTLDGTDHGLRIKSDPSRGGLVQHVSYENVCMRNVGNPILLDTRYTAFTGNKTPVYRDIVLRDVNSLTPGGLALLGLDEKNRVRLTLDNVTVARPIDDLRAAHAEVRIGPRRGNFVPVGPDVAVANVNVGVDGGARADVPLDCSKRFVPFTDTSNTPTAATKVPPEDRTMYVACPAAATTTPSSAPSTSPPRRRAVISIGPGTYRERLVVKKPGIFLRGAAADPAKTVIVGSESAGSTGSTFKSATVEVTARDFRAENLTIANDFNRNHFQRNRARRQSR